MKLLCTADNSAIAWNIRNMVELQGVAAEVRNEQLFSAAGELPVWDAMPEVWVHPLADIEELTLLVQQISNDNKIDPQAKDEEWTCTTCGEIQPTAFDFCWQCNTEQSKLPC